MRSSPAALGDEGEDEVPRGRISHDQVAELLCAQTALAELDRDDARRVVRYMIPKRVRTRTLIMREGETEATHFLLLVLDGTVEVRDDAALEQAERVLAVLGPGDILGELSLVDGEARSASCVALGSVSVAVLTRQAFQNLLEREPAVAARLLTVLLQQLGRRFRDVRRRLKVVLQINACLSRELGGKPHPV